MSRARSAEELERWVALRRYGYTYLAIAVASGVGQTTVWNWLRRLHGPGGGVAPGKPDECSNGHLRTEANTYVWKTGTRHCRECRNKNQRDRNERLRERSAKALLRRTG